MAFKFMTVVNTYGDGTVTCHGGMPDGAQIRGCTEVTVDGVAVKGLFVGEADFVTTFLNAAQNQREIMFDLIKSSNHPEYFKYFFDLVVNLFPKLVTVEQVIDEYSNMLNKEEDVLFEQIRADFAIKN